MLPAASLSDRLLQRVTHLGIQSGQHVVDYHEELDAFPEEPRAGGSVIDKATGLLSTRPRYNGDDVFKEVERMYLNALEEKSDFKYVVSFSGHVNLPPFELIQDDNQWRLQQLATNFRDAYLSSYKARQVNMEKRLALLDGMVQQQERYKELIQRLERFNQAMAPTVRRFYWLASATGYPFDTETTLQPTSSVLPYWLLTRYIQPQYAKEPGTLKGSDFANDTVYWEPLTPRHKWAADFLAAYRLNLLDLLTVTDSANRAAVGRMYLFLRDLVLAPAFRLKPPVTAAQAPRSLQYGQYENLPMKLEAVRKIINGGLNLETVTGFAVTRDEALSFKEKAGSTRAEIRFELIKKDEKDAKKTSRSDIEKGFGGYIDSAVSFVQKRKATEVPKPLLEKWIPLADKLLLQMGALPSLAANVWEGLWDDRHRSLTRPREDADFARLLLPALAIKERPNDPAVAADATYSDDNVRMEIAHALLNPQTEVRRFDTLVTINKVIIDASTTSTQFEMECTATNPTVPGRTWIWNVTCSFGDWNDWKEKAATYISQFDIVTPGFVLDQSAAPEYVYLNTQLASAFTWSYLFSQEASRTALLRYLRGNFVTPVPADPKAVTEHWTPALNYEPYIKEMPAIKNLLTRLASWCDLPAHFYKELLRSTFADPFKRENVSDDVRFLQPDPLGVYRQGDVDPKDLGTRIYDPLKESSNTGVFAYNWEPVYLNMFMQGTAAGNQRLPENPDKTTPYSDASFYWPLSLELAAQTALKKANSPNAIFDALWQTIVDSHRPLFAMVTPELSASGVPSLTTFSLNLGADGKGASNKEGESDEFASDEEDERKEKKKEAPIQPAVMARQVIQSVATSYTAMLARLRARIWDPSIIMPTTDIPPLALLQAMIAFVNYFYPKEHERLIEASQAIAADIEASDKVVRAAVSANRDVARKDIESLITELDIPDMRWQMQGIFTGRLTLRAYFTASLDRAYALIQNKAHEDYDAETNRNRYNKRGVFISVDRSYSHLRDIPLDVWTANTDPGYDFERDTAGKPVPDPNNKHKFLLDTRQPTRDYIAVGPGANQTPDHIVANLRSDMAFLHAQTLISMRLDVPEQYKTQRQYDRSPALLQAAAVALRKYNFTPLGNNAWRVERRF